MSFDGMRCFMAVACVVGLMAGACDHPVVEEDPPELGSALEELIPLPGRNEVRSRYYSDESYSLLVGWEHTGCGGQVSSWGTTSGFSTFTAHPC